MSNSPKAGLSDNLIAAFAYFTFFMAIFFLAIRRYNKRPFVRFHAWQSLLLNVFATAFGYALIYLLPHLRFLGPRVAVALVYVAIFIGFLLWLWCVIGAMNGKRLKLPVIGDWADEQAYR